MNRRTYYINSLGEEDSPKYFLSSQSTINPNFENNIKNNNNNNNINDSKNLNSNFNSKTHVIESVSNRNFGNYTNNYLDKKYVLDEELIKKYGKLPYSSFVYKSLPISKEKKIYSKSLQKVHSNGYDNNNKKYIGLNMNLISNPTHNNNLRFNTQIYNNTNSNLNTLTDTNSYNNGSRNQKNYIHNTYNDIVNTYNKNEIKEILNKYSEDNNNNNKYNNNNYYYDKNNNNFNNIPLNNNNYNKIYLNNNNNNYNKNPVNNKNNYYYNYKSLKTDINETDEKMEKIKYEE